MNTDQIRKLAQDLIEFADRADRLGIEEEDIAIIVPVNDEGDENSLIVTGGSEDDKNAFFYLDTKPNLETL
jgi:hypothetical protein